MTDAAASGSATRRRLLDAAVAELNEVGEARASLRSIARRAGMHHQGIRHYFASRGALFAEVAAEGFRTLEQYMDEDVSETAATAIDNVAAIGAAYLRFARTDPTRFHLMFGSNLPDRKHEALTAAGTATFAKLKQTVTVAHENGWGQSLDETQFTVACWSLVHGMAELRANGLISTDEGDRFLLDLLLPSLARVAP